MQRQVVYRRPGARTGLLVDLKSTESWLTSLPAQTWFHVRELPDDGERPVWYGDDLAELLGELKRLEVGALEQEDPAELAIRIETMLLAPDLGLTRVGDELAQARERRRRRNARLALA